MLLPAPLRPITPTHLAAADLEARRPSGPRTALCRGLRVSDFPEHVAGPRSRPGTSSPGSRRGSRRRCDILVSAARNVHAPKYGFLPGAQMSHNATGRPVCVCKKRNPSSSLPDLQNAPKTDLESPEHPVADAKRAERAGQEDGPGPRVLHPAEVARILVAPRQVAERVEIQNRAGRSPAPCRAGRRSA